MQNTLVHARARVGVFMLSWTDTVFMWGRAQEGSAESDGLVVRVVGWAGMAFTE